MTRTENRRRQRKTFSVSSS